MSLDGINLQSIRDVALIALALLAILQILVLLVISISLYRKVGPLYKTIQMTLGNVQGTTAFLSETTVSPVIRILSFLAGLRAATSKVANAMKGRQERDTKHE